MLKVENLSVIYPNGHRAMNNASLTMEEGVMCGILGPNGSGKTTLIKGILGLVPAKGKATFRGRPIKEFAKQISYVEQKSDLDMDFPITVFQCVLTGTYPGLGFFRKPGKKEKEITQAAIDKVGLNGMESRQIGQLSGGQFQRVLIARTLAQDADLIFLDEPFVGIDVTSEKIIVNQLKELVREGKTIFVVHHDLNKVYEYFDKIILINKTVMAYGNVREVYNRENMKKTFEVLDNPLFAEE